MNRSQAFDTRIRVSERAAGLDPTVSFRRQLASILESKPTSDGGPNSVDCVRRYGCRVGDLHPDGAPIRREVDEHALLGLHRANAVVAGSTGQVQVGHKWLPVSERDFEVSTLMLGLSGRIGSLDDYDHHHSCHCSSGFSAGVAGVIPLPPPDVEDQLVPPQVHARVHAVAGREDVASARHAVLEGVAG